MQQLIDNSTTLSQRIRFLIQNVVDLKNNNWIPKVDESAETLQEVEATQNKQEDTLKSTTVVKTNTSTNMFNASFIFGGPSKQPRILMMNYYKNAPSKHQPMIPPTDYNENSAIIQNIDDDLNNDKYYSSKLIQFKDLEKIKLNYFQSKYKKSIFEDLAFIKEYLNENCPNLKHVLISNKVYMENYKLNGYQVKLSDGFFKFKKLLIFLGRENVKDSFKSITLFNPIKITISSLKHEKDQTSKVLNELDNLDGILDNSSKSLKSIQFYYHNTPNSFIEKVFKHKQLSNIKSLKLQPTIDNSFLESLRKGVIPSDDSDSPNNKIKKLIFLNNLKKSYFFDHTLVTIVIELVGSNLPSITSLGLDAFRINNSKLLLPLNLYTNITTLYCNLSDLEFVLEHCSTQNSIIKHLIVQNANEKPNNDATINSNIFGLLLKFFNHNSTMNSNLQSIILKLHGINSYKCDDIYKLNKSFKIVIILKPLHLELK